MLQYDVYIQRCNDKLGQRGEFVPSARWFHLFEEVQPPCNRCNPGLQQNNSDSIHAIKTKPATMLWSVIIHCVV